MSDIGAADGAPAPLGGGPLGLVWYGPAVAALRSILLVAACGGALGCGRAPPPGVFLASGASVEDYELITGLARGADPAKTAIFDDPKDGDVRTAPFTLRWHLSDAPADGWTFLLDVRSLGDALLEVVTREPLYAIEEEPWARMQAAGDVEICAVATRIDDGQVLEGPFAGTWVIFRAE